MKNPKTIKIGFAWIFFSIILVYSLLFSFFYNYYVHPGVEGFDKKFRHVRGQLVFELPQKDTYLVKIWATTLPSSIYFNRKGVSVFKIRDRGGQKEAHMAIDGRLVSAGPNVMTLGGNESYSVKIRNFYGATDSKDIYVVFKTSRFLKFSFIGFISITFLAYLVLILFWISFYFMTRFIFVNLEIREIFKLFCILNFSLFLFFLLFAVIFSFTSYRVILTRYEFLSIGISYLFLLNLGVFTWFLFRKSRQLRLSASAIKFVNRFFEIPVEESKMLSIFAGELKLEFKKRPERALVLLFIFLVILAMISLYIRLPLLAEVISYLSYFCLWFAVGTKISRFIKENQAS
jgi:hypothetical protein